MNRPAPSAGFERTASAGFSAREFLRMMELGAFEEMRAELVGGVIEKMTPAYMHHGEANARLLVALAEAYRGTAFRLATDLVIRIDDETVRAVDIAVTVPELPGDRAASGSELVLAVEIADATLARDLGDKRRDYARAGVPAYWVVDVKARAVHVFDGPANEEYSRVEVIRSGEPLTPPQVDRGISVEFG